MKMKTHNAAICLLVIVIIILSCALFFGEKTVVNTDPAIQRIKDQLRKEEVNMAYWQKQAEQWKAVADSGMAVNDSLEKLPGKIRIVYENTYKTIAVSNNAQLDSIIRANW